MESIFIVASRSLIDWSLKETHTSKQNLGGMAFKGGRSYNLTLAHPQRSRKKQKIKYDPGTHAFYAIPADDPSAEPLYFSVDEVIDISEV